MNTNEANFAESFDARVWTKAWLDTIAKNPSIPTDEGTMLGWFANALMRGYDEHANAHRNEIEEWAERFEEATTQSVKSQIELMNERDLLKDDYTELRERHEALAWQFGELRGKSDTLAQDAELGRAIRWAEASGLLPDTFGCNDLIISYRAAINRTQKQS